MTFCMLEKSGVATPDLDEGDEAGEVEETVEGVRIDLPLCLPWLIVTTGYTATSRGGKCIMKDIGSKG